MLPAPRSDPMDVWTHNYQGTAFQELVVKPTFAPHLARPYEMPGIYPRSVSDNGEDFADHNTQEGTSILVPYLTCLTIAYHSTYASGSPCYLGS